MLNVKKFENLLAEGQKRAAELQKLAAPKRRAFEEAQGVADDIQRQLMALRQRLAAFEAGTVDMSDDDFISARATVDLLQIKGKRASEAAAAARSILDTAENDSRAELAQLRSAAMAAWQRETFEASDEYRKAWLVL